MGRNLAFHQLSHSHLSAHAPTLQVRICIVFAVIVPVKDKERTRRTDRLDCHKLARSLRSGESEGIYVPFRPRVEDRSLIRTRHGMVKKRTRCKNQIKSILQFYGIPEELANSHRSKRFIAWIEAIRMERASGNFALKVHLKELNNMRKITADITRGIRTLANSEEYRQNVRLLKIPCPGLVL